MGEVGKWVAAAREQKHSMALDNGGFSQLVLLFQDMAYGYAYALTRDPWTARDVVQESFLRAWLRLEQLDDPDAFPGWFRRIVRSTAVDELRRAGSRTAAAPPIANRGPVRGRAFGPRASGCACAAEGVGRRSPRSN